MTKAEFLQQLESNLLRLSKSDRDDILLDYEEHFRAGAEKGMSEDEVCLSLGNPQVIAQTFLENLPADAKGAPAAAVQPEAAAGENSGAATYASSQPMVAQPQAAKSSPDAGGIILLILLVLFVYIPVASTIIGLWLGIAATALGMGITALVLFVVSFFNIGTSGLAFAGLLLLAISSAALCALLVIACVYSVKGIIWLCKKVYKFSVKLVKGGF